MSGFRQRWAKVPKGIRVTLYVILGSVGVALLVLFFGWLIQFLWNRLMPAIFGLKEISFWQGIGLFALARLLFAGFGGHSSNSTDRKKGECRKDDAQNDWRHYDEWWEREGKKAFRVYADGADAEENRD